MNKEEYISYAKQIFIGKSLDIVLNQIELFYQNNTGIEINKYSKGDDVYLKKETFIHGIPNSKDNFNFVINHGFIGSDFTNDSNSKNKIKHSIGMWNIKEDCYLKDYIIDYSGFTITYNIGRGPESKKVSKLISYHKFDEVTEKINNDNNIWSYNGEQTKEVRFIPSLVSDKVQIAFILNTESNYAKKMLKNDIWKINIDKEEMKEFLDYRYYDKFFIDKDNRDATTTDRESAIIFGLPPSLIEGILVGRKLEKDTKILSFIKSKLPNIYICNLDGKVVVGNK